MKYAYGEYALLFKTLSDVTRLHIIQQLRTQKELCAGDILNSLSITQPTLSYHMKLLSESGLIHSRRDGSWIKYTLNESRIDDICTFLNAIKTCE